MAVLKYKDPQGNWQTLDTGSGSVSSVEITELPYGSEPTARISAGTLYIGWPDGVPIDSVITDESDNPVTSAAIYQALQEKIGIPSGGTTGQVLTKTSGTDYDAGWATPEAAPVQSVNGQTGAVVLDAQDVGAYEKPASGIPASDLAVGVIPAVPVQDVQVNGVSVLTDGVANVPKASQSAGLGVVAAVASNGIAVNANGQLYTSTANADQLKAGSNVYKPIVPSVQHSSTFYGLAKSAGDTTQSASSNPVGTYTDAAKVAIQKMLGIYEAPWELIREDTVTNATEADIDITVDGNGQPFELTDVALVFTTPKQDNVASFGGDGTIRFYYSDTNYVISWNGAWTQSANASANGTYTVIENKRGGLVTNMSMLRSTSVVSNMRSNWSTSFEGSNMGLQIIQNFTVSKIVIRLVTGTGHYKLYGKRKWQ